MKHAQSGFSLVEVAIVVTIIGLLAGGILGTRSLIRMGEIKSVMSEYQKYKTAAGGFDEKYNAIPGDMRNAQTYWGIAHATAATCKTTPSSDTKTCNGDGDGRINSSTGSNEGYRFWQHLANAGYIEGTYNGVKQSTNDWSSSSANSPTSQLGSNTLWLAWNWPGISGSTIQFDGVYGNIFLVGGFRTDNTPALPILRPEEMWNMDTKLDDGRPATGNLVVWANNGLGTCTSSALPTDMTASYLITTKSLECAPMWRQVI